MFIIIILKSRLLFYSCKYVQPILSIRQLQPFCYFFKPFSSQTTVNHHTKAGSQVVDMYSENAMDELEALSNDSDEPNSPRPNSIDLTNSHNMNMLNEEPRDHLSASSPSSPAVLLREQNNQVCVCGLWWSGMSRVLCSSNM